jgi:hypothetical protein
MLPTTPLAHRGRRNGPGRIGVGDTPSRARASRAQLLAIVNSRRRFPQRDRAPPPLPAAVPRPVDRQSLRPQRRCSEVCRRSSCIPSAPQPRAPFLRIGSLSKIAIAKSNTPEDFRIMQPGPRSGHDRICAHCQRIEYRRRASSAGSRNLAARQSSPRESPLRNRRREQQKSRVRGPLPTVVHRAAAIESYAKQMAPADDLLAKFDAVSKNVCSSGRRPAPLPGRDPNAGVDYGAKSAAALNTEHR